MGKTIKELSEIALTAFLIAENSECLHNRKRAGCKKCDKIQRDKIIGEAFQEVIGVNPYKGVD